MVDSKQTNERTVETEADKARKMWVKPRLQTIGIDQTAVNHGGPTNDGGGVGSCLS